jgi:hypothetical protein
MTRIVLVATMLRTVIRATGNQAPLFETDGVVKAMLKQRRPAKQAK